MVEKKPCPAQLHAGTDDGGGIRYVFEHFHAGHDIETTSLTFLPFLLLRFSRSASLCLIPSYEGLQLFSAFLIDQCQSLGLCV